MFIFPFILLCILFSEIVKLNSFSFFYILVSFATFFAVARSITLTNASSKRTPRHNVTTKSRDKPQGVPKKCFYNSTLSLGYGVQGWRSGESTRLPPMWPGFDSQIRRQMSIEFVGSLLCTERFSPGTPVSPLLKNQNLT